MTDEMNENEAQDDIETTGEDNIDELEIEEIETNSNQKLKQIKAKLKACEVEKSEILDTLQRSKAEFLNARKRLADEQRRANERHAVSHIEKLLPLCDSFQMAMSNEETWNLINPEWRKGVESIYNQLQKILTSYEVNELKPIGETFDPNQHEALSEISVDDQSADNTIVSVIQNGYAIERDGKQEIIRPARVTVGVFEEK